MTLTNKGAFELLQYMSNLHETGKLGFFIAKNMRMIKTEIQEYIALRDHTISKYAAPGGVAVADENIPLFLEEMRPYDEIECEIDPAQVDEALFISGTLNSKDMFNLDWMVKAE